MSLKDAVNKIESVYGKRPDVQIEEVGRWDVVSYHYLHMFSLCKELRCLPASGGLEDQDWLVLHFFTVISDCIGKNLQAEYERAKS